mmetsp:Transcript_22045/g.48166  ORF Transcript_22045/g.48166 Transcript_22045/m.48166 type:complete len:841 (-) Transcript_22045:70-2592(-)
MSEPPEKKQKVGDGEEEKEVEKKPQEVVKEETEKDAGKAPASPLKDAVGFPVQYTTLNVLPASTKPGLLMALSEGIMTSFAAGARANVGLEGGRYFFEAKVIEFYQAGMLKIGFSAAGSSLILGSEGSVCFDSESGFWANGKRCFAGARFGVETVLGVLLNLEKSSPNFNTISLFKDGVRACEPQPLPENLKGKALYPHVTYRGATIYTNFGPTPLCPLPFKCYMVQQAGKAHCKVTAEEKPKDGKFDVSYVVGLPDQGAFDWLDMWKEKNPQYTELSDRMVLEWAEASGLRPKRSASLDRPLIGLDDRAIRRAVYSIAPYQPRNYVVMELKSNLVEEDRKQLLAKFDSETFTKTAMVIVGDPPADFKKRVTELNLKQKQEISDRLFKAKKHEEAMKRLAEKRKKDAEKLKKKQLKEAQKKIKALEAEKKAKLKAERKAKAEAEGKTFEEEEEKEEEPEKEEASEEEEVEEEVVDDEEPPQVTLDADEKKATVVKRDAKDLSQQVLASSFASFSLPTEEEGFDDVNYLWSKADKGASFLKNWILEKKLTTRVEDLTPGEWAGKVSRDFTLALSIWQRKLQEYKDKVAKKARDKAAKEMLAKAKAEAEAKKKDEKKAEEEEAKKEEELEAKEEEEEEIEPVDFDKLDIYGVKNVLDIGDESPLFKEFGPLDWALMTLRFELFLLVKAFEKDVKDPDRPGITVDHVPFYYQKYFKKALILKDWGVETSAELVALVNDAVYVTKQGVLQSFIAPELETFAVFVKLTEHSRRQRSLDSDLGKETPYSKINTRFIVGKTGNQSSGNYGQMGGYGKAQDHMQRGGPYAGGYTGWKKPTWGAPGKRW